MRLIRDKLPGKNFRKNVIKNFNAKLRNILSQTDQ